MAVYTPVSSAQLATFLDGYAIGPATKLDGILQGIENSNFRLETPAGKFVLTVFERRAAADDLPYFLGLMRHLAGKGFPAPEPLIRADGAMIGALSGKPAAIVRFLSGDWPENPSIADAGVVGAGLARLHVAAADFSATRANSLGADAWPDLFEGSSATANTVAPGLSAEIRTELAHLKKVWPQNLPSGPIHADLFPDNMFLQDGALSGVIDFYFACNDAYAYDLAITLNAWCFGPDNDWRAGHAAALMAGYTAERPLSDAEYTALPVLLRGAAMRFLLTRLYDWLHPRADALARPKDPLEQLAQLRHHQNAPSSL